MEVSRILITGASSGIGAALAQALAAPGRSLALIGRDEARLAGVAAAARKAGAQVETAQIDIADTARLVSFMQDFDARGPVDLVIANAGILAGRDAAGEIENAAIMRSVLDINLLGSLETLHAVLPAMRARGRGQIALVSSLAGFAPLPDAPAYSASKAGLVSYGLAMREAVGRDGVRVNVICPGYVTSRMTATHMGPKPGEIPAADAALRILRGLAANRALIGFPFFLFLGSRLTMMLPEWIRRISMNGLRFHVAGPGGG